jgi:CHAD domain-containing protein
MSELGLRADQRYCDAARRVIEARSGELRAHVDRVVDSDQPERVHKMRVATRRLRAGLEVFAACYPPRQVKKALVEVKALAAVLGERRDCDVQIELLRSLRRDAGRTERGAIDDLLDQLAGEQRDANVALAKALAGAEAKLERRLRRLSR